MSDKGTILVVDDDRLVLATLTHGLAQAGYRVIDADGHVTGGPMLYLRNGLAERGLAPLGRVLSGKPPV